MASATAEMAVFWKEIHLQSLKAVDFLASVPFQKGFVPLGLVAWVANILSNRCFLGISVAPVCLAAWCFGGLVGWLLGLFLCLPFPLVCLRPKATKITGTG